MVKLSDVVDTMDLTNDLNYAYLHRQTGELVMLSDDTLSTAESKDDFSDYADWEKEELQIAKQVLETDDYLKLPDQFEIDEYSIMESFCLGLDKVSLSADLLNLIKGSGAFRRFKNAINRHDIADDWYRYKQSALEKIAADWLEENGIAYEGKVSAQPAKEADHTSKMNFEGTWRIYEMDMWDEDYFNMEVQAYITVNSRGTGDFQFGLVCGDIDGEIVKDGETERLEFTWEGSDECDEAYGGGWIRLKTVNELEGRIKLHGGDSSMFLAKRA